VTGRWENPWSGEIQRDAIEVYQFDPDNPIKMMAEYHRRLEWSGERGTAPVVMRVERLKDVMALCALERMQVGTQKRRHDAGEHHLGPALRADRTLDCSERNDGRQGLRV
jgi:hypothetical protein